MPRRDWYNVGRQRGYSGTDETGCYINDYVLSLGEVSREFAIKIMGEQSVIEMEQV